MIITTLKNLQVLASDYKRCQMVTYQQELKRNDQVRTMFSVFEGDQTFQIARYNYKIINQGRTKGIKILCSQQIEYSTPCMTH